MVAPDLQRQNFVNVLIKNSLGNTTIALVDWNSSLRSKWLLFAIIFVMSFLGFELIASCGLAGGSSLTTGLFYFGGKRVNLSGIVVSPLSDCNLGIIH